MFKWLKDDVLYEAEAPDLERAVCQLLIPKVGRAARGRGAARLPGLPGDVQVLHPAPFLPPRCRGRRGSAPALVTSFVLTPMLHAGGMCHLQLSKKDLGEYKATLKDDRGQDVSVLEIAGKGKATPPRPPRQIRVANGTPRPSKARPPGPGGARCWLSGNAAQGNLCLQTCFRVLENCPVSRCVYRKRRFGPSSNAKCSPVTNVVTTLETGGGAGIQSNGALHLCGVRFSRSLGKK